MEQAVTESPQWLFMESSWKTKSIRLGTPSHGYWLSVSDYEAAAAGGRWCGEGSESEARSGIHEEREGESEKGESWEGGRMFWCFWNSQTSVRCRCWRGKHAAVFSSDRGRSRKEAGAYEPEQCTESAKHCILKIMWLQCTAPLHHCIIVSVLSLDSWNLRMYTVEICETFQPKFS